MAKAAETQIAAFQKRFPVLDPTSDAAELIRINMGEEDINAGDLVKVKVPSGGGTLWEIPTINGAEGAKELTGVIIHMRRNRAYWPGREPVGGEAPQCRSDDMKVGIGDPGGACDVCPLNQFESATSDDGSPGRGKACKETVQVFLLREGDKLPTVVRFPPGSLGDFKKWRLQLDVPYFYCVTSLSLHSDKNESGTKYSKIQAELKEVLDGEAREGIVSYVKTMKSLFERVSSVD